MESVTVQNATALDANEVLVVYRYDDDKKTVSRRIQHGPSVYMPAADEWCVLMGGQAVSCPLLMNVSHTTRYRYANSCLISAGCTSLYGTEQTPTTRQKKYLEFSNLPNFASFLINFTTTVKKSVLLQRRHLDTPFLPTPGTNQGRCFTHCESYDVFWDTWHRNHVEPDNRPHWRFHQVSNIHPPIYH